MLLLDNVQYLVCGVVSNIFPEKKLTSELFYFYFSVVLNYFSLFTSVIFKSLKDVT